MGYVTDKILARKINTLARRDQQMRRKVVRNDLRDKNIDQQNTEELKRIVDKYGWPTVPLVGKKASFNAWLLAQHADHDLQFQVKILKLLKVAYEKNSKNVDVKNIAYLTDRILVNKGEKQIYGTQFYRKSGKLVPRPIKDRKNLDQRRESVGLEPFNSYKKRFSQDSLN